MVCEGHIAFNFANPVTNTLAPNAFIGTGTIDDCISPNHNSDSIVRGSVVASGSGTLSCGRKVDFSEKAIYTWFDASGNVVGSTTAEGSGLALDDEAKNDLVNIYHGTGTVGSSLFAGRQITSAFTPFDQVGNCDDGVKSMNGDFDVEVSG
jgi:hypothetical protein